MSVRWYMPTTRPTPKLRVVAYELLLDGFPGLTLGIRRHLASILLFAARRLEESIRVAECWPSRGRVAQ